jgi:hypothetical protein
MKRSMAAALGSALAALTLFGGSAALAGPATAAQPYCGIRWGSLPKVADGELNLDTEPLVNIRAGRHACFDRLVLDLAGGDTDGYSVRYVRELKQDGSGEVVDLDGGATLEIVAILPALDEKGNRLYDPVDPLRAVHVSGFRTFRQVASLSNFEAHEQVGLGVRARLPFRVFELDGPGEGSRVVVDVAHRW